jgi:hypothetical protein
MLKSPKRFASINCHNNLTPTLLAFLAKNYNLKHIPNQVHWMNGVMDTATQFRNIHQISFMTYSRAMESFMFKDYFLCRNHLYKIKPDMSQQECHSTAVMQKTKKLRQNFININNWVYENNHIVNSQYPIAKKQKN